MAQNKSLRSRNIGFGRDFYKEADGSLEVLSIARMKAVELSGFDFSLVAAYGFLSLGLGEVSQTIIAVDIHSVSAPDGSMKAASG